MATNNELNSGSTPLLVSQGGSGLASTVAYTPICGGTTTTGALQSVASLGTSGQILQSQGSALPQFATPANFGTSSISYTKVSLTSAQIKSMRTTAPIQLVAAGGTHTLLVALSCYIELVFNSIAYTGGGVVSLVLGSSSSVDIADTVSAACITSAVSATTFVLQATTANLSAANGVNKGIFRTNATGAFATGNSTANVHLYYSVLSTTI